MTISTFKQYLKQAALPVVMTASAITLSTQAFTTGAAHAGAGVFEIVHPDVEEGEVEVEILNGVGLGSVEDGEERSVHEFAVGVGITDFWKLTGALELANPEGEHAEVEAFELESLFILFGGHGHDEDDKADADEDEHHSPTVGLFTALEIPREGGIGEGGLEIGPVFETEVDPFEFIGNLLVEVPFAHGEDPGLAYGTQVVFPLNESLGIGVENYGVFEGLFGDGGEDVHFAGPGLYWKTTLPNGHVFAPRIAVLFGLNDDAPDAILSANIEYKIPPQ